MSVFDGLRFRLAAWLRPARFARDLDEEMRFHQSLEAMQQAHGPEARTPDDARLAARRRFGNVVTHTEEARHAAGLSFLDVLRQDLRFALRGFRRTPGFTLVAVLTLAIGIGATTAIFGAVHTVLLRPLPYREPDRLMKLSLSAPAHGDAPARDDAAWSWPKARSFRDAQRIFASLTLYSDPTFTVRHHGDVERTHGEVTDEAYFTTLGLPLALGRSFTAGDNRTGAERVAIVSDAYWRRRLGADARVLGASLSIDGKSYTIVGVGPRGFRGLSGRAELWLPVLAERGERIEHDAWRHSLWMVGRLAPGITVERARAEVPALGRRVDTAWPDPDGAALHWSAIATPLDAARAGPLVRRSLLVLLGAVSLVLLIACANVANLLLVRAVGRRREIAVRLALGAGRRRLVRQLITESMLLTLAGGAAGLLIALWGTQVLSRFDPVATLRVAEMGAVGGVPFESIRLGLPTLSFAVLLTVVTGVLFGLAPALQATRLELHGALKDDRGGGPSARRDHRGVLAGLEIALALVLLAGAGLMLRSLANLMAVQDGVSTERVLTLRVSPPDGAPAATYDAFWREIVARVAAVSGVEAVAIGSCTPLSGGCFSTSAVRRDRPAPAPGLEPSVGVHGITPDWLATLGVPLLRGRAFVEADRAGAPKVVLVSRTAARRLWGAEDPIGKPLSVGLGDYQEDTATVVGVVGDVRFTVLDGPQEPDVYLAYAQGSYSRGVVFVRTTGDPLHSARAVREAVRRAAPDSPIDDLRTLEARTADASAYARFGARLLALFAGVALALATLGVYGVVSAGVAQRTREIGVRIALGATRRDVLRLVVGQGAAILAAGGSLGLVGALAGTRVLRAFLFDVSPTEPRTLAATLAVLGAAVLGACLVPARRAAALAPTEALRAD